MKRETMADVTALTKREIRRRMKLPWSMVLKIAIASLKHRRMRTIITVLSLGLAIAFLSNTLCCLDMARFLHATGQQQIVSTLNRMGYDMGSSAQAHFFWQSKIIWIVALSLLVCVVGIVNNQLMAVMEQYQEIGTMKCLGALDSVVFRILTTGALIEGLLGSLGGVLIGVAMALINFTGQFGLHLFGHLDLASLAGRIGVSILVGCALSLIGVAYPAVIVARMHPTEALRVDR